uniref:Uncharacterized protein n=1 Tax=Lepeophtheirus salmonis TaxID=72036 RepID=A0A0K2U7N1_LEPSM
MRNCVSVAVRNTCLGVILKIITFWI